MRRDLIAGVRLAVWAALVVTIAAPAAAQSDGRSTGGLTLEEIDNRWVIGPDFRVSEVEDEVSTVAGVYGGRLIDDRLLIGGGVYWLLDRPNETDFYYVGPLVEWSTALGGPFDLAVRGLAAFGVVTRRLRFDGVVDDGPDTPGFFGSRFSRSSAHARQLRHHYGGSVRFRDELFVAEPHVSLLTRITDWLGVNVGAGYRVTSGERGHESGGIFDTSDDFDSSLEGASFTIGFRVGG